MKPVFAIDVGGVLASWDHNGEPQPGSLKSLNRLQNSLDLWVVSQCGKKRQIETADWLEQWRFPISRDKQIYVDFKHNKTDPLNEIKAVYFIDDRLKHVIPAIENCPELEFIFHMPDRLRKAEFIYSNVTCPGDPTGKYQLVNSWQETEIMLEGIEKL